MNKIGFEMRKYFSFWTTPVGWRYNTTAFYFLNKLDFNVKNIERREIIRSL